MTKPPEHPTWEELYKNENIESMPWFTKELDPDLEEDLRSWMHWYCTGQSPVSQYTKDMIQYRLDILFGRDVLMSDDFQQVFLRSFLNSDTQIIDTFKVFRVSA